MSESERGSPVRQLIKFESKHIPQMEPRLWDEASVLGIKDVSQFTKIYESQGMSFTAMVDSKPIASGGVFVVWQGLGEAWTFTTKEVEKNPLFFHRSAYKVLHETIKEFDLRRVQTTVMEGHTTSQAWLERLGFVEESRMPLYGPEGQTYIRFAMLIEAQESVLGEFSKVA